MNRKQNDEPRLCPIYCMNESHCIFIERRFCVKFSWFWGWWNILHVDCDWCVSIWQFECSLFFFFRFLFSFFYFPALLNIVKEKNFEGKLKNLLVYKSCLKIMENFQKRILLLMTKIGEVKGIFLFLFFESNR